MEFENLLTRAVPEDVGICSQGVLAFVDAIEARGLELHSMMLLRHGRVAAEGWWAPYAPELPHMMFSLSKSFTSMAAGLAICEGLFQLDDPVLDYFADCAPKRPSENLKAMRVRDLLCMGTGHDTEPGRGSSKGWEKTFLSHPVVHRPGTYFLYNSMATFMVSSLITRRAGMGLMDYLKPRLFDKLGIETPVWDENGDGIACGGWGLNITTEDIARFGQMLLQEGMWRGERVVPAHWVRLATGWQIDNSKGRQGDWAQGYGFQFWRCKNDLYRGDGMFGQNCIVMPKQNAVLALTAGVQDLQGVLDLAYEHLLPTMKDSLPPNPVAYEKMKNRLANLTLPILEAGESEIAPQLLGKRFAIGEKDEYLRVMLEKREGCLAVETRRGRTSHLRAGFDAPVKGVFTDEDGRKLSALAQAKGRPGGGVLIHIRMPETPFRAEIELKPDGTGAQMRARFAPHGKPLEECEWAGARVE